jgi:filamentous hemagglutinin family protein
MHRHYALSQAPARQAVRPPDLRRWSKRLLAGTSALAFGICAMPAAVAASQFGTADYFNQLANRRGTAGEATSAAQSLPLSALAQQIARRSAADLAQASHAIAAAEAAQIAARSAAAARTPTVPNGLAPGGLVVDPGVPTTPALWQNALQPVAATTGGATTVTITQTDAKAILTWLSFDVGRQTTVYFDQAAGTDASGDNNWVALNRIVDPTGVPSQILGRIRAEGSVYLIDRNGILFGGSSQVNVHGLIASSLDIGELGQSVDQRNAQFLHEGLNILSNGGLALTNQNVAFSSTTDPLTTPPEGAVTVDSGAEIATTVQGADNPGSVLLLAPKVANAGSIASPAGQVILGAGRAFAFLENTEVGTNGAEYLGLVVQSNPFFLLQGSPYDIPPLPDYLPGMSARNTGLIETDRGNITLEGTNVTNDGVLAATTSITRNGSIVVQAVNNAKFGPDSLVSILPDAAAAATESIPQSQISAATFPAPYIQIQAAEISNAGSTGDAVIGVGSLFFDSGAAVIAPGATVGMFGGQSVYLSQNALIDVAGLTSATLPMSANYITFNPRGPEFADSPLQRDGPLRGASITIDIRDSGVSADGLSWVGTPLAAAAGYVAQVPETIDQLLAAGGTVSISTALGQNTANYSSIVLQSGSTIDVSGGFVTYQGGAVPTTRLIGADGAVYDIAAADPNLTYLGLAGSFTDDHPRWGVSTTFTTPLLAGGQTIFEPGYIEGHDAGGIELRADAIVEAGNLLGQVPVGPHQLAAGELGTAAGAASDDTRHLQADAQQLPSAGYLIFDPTSSANSTIASLEDGQAVSPEFTLIQQAPVALPADLGPNTVFSRTAIVADPADAFSGLDPADLADTMVLSAAQLNAGGFGEISIQGTTRETAGTSLVAADGGSISIAGVAVKIKGDLVARAGSIKLVSNGGGDLADPAGTPSIILAAGATLDASGYWVNDTGLGADAEGPGYVNGGSVSLLSDARAVSRAGTAKIIDTTGGILVDPDALIDVSSGGYIGQNGKVRTSGGVPVGTGGNVTLETYAGGYSPDGVGRPKFPTRPNLAASISVDLADSISAFGFKTGGTLTISVGPSVKITDEVDRITTAADGTLELPNTMFGTDNPFGAFDIGSDSGSVVVAADTRVVLRQSNFQISPASYRLATGSDVYAAGPRGGAVNPIELTEAFDRAPVDLTLGPGSGDLSYYTTAAASAGRVVVQPGATIQSAADGTGGAAISLVGTYQVDLLGRIVAPSGSVTLDATGNTENGVSELDGTEVANGEVYLAPGSLIDVKGETLIDPTNAADRSGAVLPGGSVTLQADGSADKNGGFGYVATAAASRIDLDGASGSLQFQAGAGPSSIVTQTVASDAGELTIDATAAILGGAVAADGGGADAANGILTLTSGTAATVQIVQGRRTLPAGSKPGDVLTTLAGSSGKAHFIRLSAESLDQSDFDDINFGVVSDADPAGASGIQNIAFDGDVELDARRAIRFYAPLGVVPSGAAQDPEISIAAPYLLFATTLQNQNSTTQRGIGTLDATGDMVVLQRGWIDAAETRIESAGDVAIEGILNTVGQNYASGGLVATGDLTVDANRIYPTGGNEGVLQALGFSGGTQGSSKLDIEGNGTATAPLSAGGVLYLLAAHITQDGTVWAPGGQIVFGNSAAAARFPFLGTNAQIPATTDAKSVSFGAGSVTSVSLNGLDLPYGGTVDQSAWYYGDDPTRSNTPLTSLPGKQISVNAGSIDLQTGATIDLSGGGDLYATEFVPGNGGSRNVLSTANKYSSAAFDPGLAGNVATDNSVEQVYAIVPGYGSGLAPSDVDFSTATGLGLQSAPAGLSVDLSGIAGLKAGTYALLPAAYATLPGAYRVVVTGTTDFQPVQNQILPDGSYLVSGNFAIPMAGERTSLALQFVVQSSAVWRQYSQIDQTGANSFFASSASGATVQRPEDAGHLILSATKAINLAGTLDNAAPAGALSSEVDISASDIEVVSPGETALPGYVSLDADQVTGLDAGSVLIGGTRAGSPLGDVVTITADSVVVANDAAHPLAGPEILLATAGAAGSSDPDGSIGLRIAAGAVVEGRGGVAGTIPTDIVIGHLPTGPSDPDVAVDGDGALIAVSAGDPITLDRENVPGQPGSTSAASPLGSLTIKGGAELIGNSVVIDTADLGRIDPSAMISAESVTIGAEQLGLGAAPKGSPGLILSGANLAALAGTTTLELHSYSGISFYGAIDLDLAGANSTLVLNAGGLAGNGGSVSLGAATVELENPLDSAFVAASGSDLLAIGAQTIEFGTGGLALSGFGRVQLDAGRKLAITGVGGLAAGAASVTVETPLIVAGAGAAGQIATTGTVVLDQPAGAAALPDAGGALGGSIAIDAGTITVDTTIDDPAGSITLDATSGDLTLASGARLTAKGFARSFFDVTRYAAGGTVDLAADQGNVIVASGSEIDVSGAAGGGDAGSVSIDAAAGTVTLAGALAGGSSDGTGGSFSLRQQGAFDLDALAGVLAGAGFHDSVAVETATGDLDLSGTLVAASVALTADGGAVTIGSAGEIDASGDRGGEIRLFGTAGVDIQGRLLAKGTNPARAGGDVEIGTAGTFDGTYDANWGYEQVATAGPVTIGAGAVIDVSGGTIDGLTGGLVHIRVPLLEDGSINLEIPAGAQIIGAHDLIVEAYASWNTTDATSGSQHFDGIIDPAGWYSDTGSLVGGTNQFGQPIAVGATLQPGQYFTPASPNLDHVQFYQQTLMGFVQDFDPTISGSAAGLTGAEFQPGIQLVNGSAATQGGTITIASNWNLGAGGYDQNGNLVLFYRTASGQPGDLTLRAVNDVVVNASLTDGFFQQLNLLDSQYLSALKSVYLPLAPNGNSTQGFYLDPLQAPSAPYDTDDQTYSTLIGLYYKIYRASYAASWTGYQALAQQLFFVNGQLQPIPAGTVLPTAPAAPSLKAPASYGASAVSYSNYAAYYANVYAPAYSAYIVTLGNACTSCAVPKSPAPLQPPPAYGDTIGSPTSAFSIAGSLSGQYGANGPANNPTVNDPNPVMSADLFPLVANANGGYGFFRSWSYTIAGGADTASADPLALLPASSFGSGSGSVTLNGHNTFASTLSTVTGLVPTIVRTGTGAIDIAAGYDFALTDTLAPGAVYTAGKPSDPLPSAGYVAVDGGSALNGPDSIAANTQSLNGLGMLGSGTGTTEIGNPAGFDAPAFGNSLVLTAPTLFAVTAPAYSEAGGHVTITAQNDITAMQNIPSSAIYSQTTAGFLTQFWADWLLTRSVAVPASSGSAQNDFNAIEGVYNPNAGHVTGSFTDLNDGQTTWWVNFGSFDQGVATLGGGDVTVTAGRNITDFSASTVATGRVSGGLSATALPALHLTGGGDLVVTAGNDIVSGAYYAALGTGRITAGGSIQADSTWTYTYFDSAAHAGTQIDVTPATIIAAGDAEITVAARGSIDLGDIVNPTEISSGVTLTVGDDYIAAHGGASSLGVTGPSAPFVFQEGQFNTMGPDSSVSVQSVGGDIDFLTLPQQSLDSRNLLYSISQRLLPASVDLSALSGDISVVSNFNLVNSASGTLDILAEENVRLANLDDSVGIGATESILRAATSAAGIATYQTEATQTIATLFPIPGLVDGQFDPENPAAAYDFAGAQYVLLHAAGSSIAHVYAATGDITNGPYTSEPDPGGSAAGTADIVAATDLPVPLLTDEPIDVKAGRDIRNLQLYAQDTQADDVTTVSAGRDIVYDLPASNVLLSNGSNGSNLIELSGPGSLVVSAGRNLGPFPNDFDVGPSGIETTGNVAWITGYEDPLLSAKGASIYAFAGVAPGIDYQAVIADYISPDAPAGEPHNYLPELVSYFADTLDTPGLSEAEAWRRFQALLPDQQHAFVDQVFFDELEATQQTGATPTYSRGYRMVNTMFPGSDGYTQNDVSGGTNGSNSPIATGKLDLRSATIQTRHGGNISIFAPGGDVLLGSSAARAVYDEPGTTGILTFQGGAISLFSDQSIIVNQSRILTEEGGNVLVWSSNGDILAGIGAKTSADFPPYTVLYDNDAVEQLDPGGLVTGAGIGAILTLPGQDPADSNAFLFAPRGTVDAGDAGIRVAGNLVVAALHVANASNIQVGGSAVGVPTAPSVNVGALAAAGAVAANAERTDAFGTGGSAQSQQAPSIIVIDVIGFGGGD